MSNEQPTRRPAPRGASGAPMGSTISIIVAVIAVILGFVILKNITDDNKSSSNGPNGTTAPTVDPSASTTTTVPIDVTPTTLPFVLTGATVIVANASGIAQTAAQFSKALGQVGFTMATPTNAGGAEATITVSKVYFLPGGEAVASSVARSMGGVAVAAMPTPVPIKDPTAGLGDATVLVMLGSDLAGKALPALAGDPTSTTVPVTTTTTGA